MSFYKLDTDAVSALVRYYQDGHSLQECAIRFESNIYEVRLLLEGKTPIRGKGNPHRELSPEKRDRVLEMYRNGDTILSIFKETKVWPPTISRLVRKHNLPGRQKGRRKGGGVVCKLSPEEYGKHIESTYPGITKLLGDTAITLEAIGKKYGITRERVRQFERRLGTEKRLPIRIEAGKINAKRRELARQERWKARGARWKKIGGEIALLIESGCSRAELVAALPWTIKGGKTPLNQRISQRLYHLRKISGVNIPKPAFFNGYGVPVGTKRK